MGTLSTSAELKTVLVKTGFSPDEINSLEWTPHDVKPIILARLGPLEDPAKPPAPNGSGGRKQVLSSGEDPGDRTPKLAALLDAHHNRDGSKLGNLEPMKSGDIARQLNQLLEQGTR
jgi:hypothetical protein